MSRVVEDVAQILERAGFTIVARGLPAEILDQSLALAALHPAQSTVASAKTRLPSPPEDEAAAG